MRRVLVLSPTYVDPAARGKLVALAARGLDVTVGVPQRWVAPGTALPVETRWERRDGIEVFPVPVRRPGEPERARFAARALAALVRDKRPDLIHVEAEPATPLAAQVVAAARRLGVPAALSGAENVRVARGLGAAWRRRRVLKRLRGFAAETEGAAALVRAERPALPVAVVPRLGVPIPPVVERVPHEGLALGFVGRLVARKGLDTLLVALGELRAQRWSLAVAGDGPERERLERLASALRLAARVRWLGALPRAQLTALWAELDVLVVPSRPEPGWAEPAAQGLAEAMAHELAVVGSATGALPEVIGDAGVVVPPGDAAALGAALARLAVESARRPLAQAARARAMRLYSDDAVAERTLAFWRSLLSRP